MPCHSSPARLGSLSTALACLAGGLVSAGAEEPAAAASETDFWSALKDGKVSANARFRYEQVDVDGVDKEAHATTLRLRLGYETGVYQGFSGFVEFEGTKVIGNKLYNDPVDNVPGRPTVLDPENAEFNRYHLRYTGIEGGKGTLGRQRVIHDGARFIGNVGWRQNEQTFDAAQIVYTGVEGLTLEYDYVFNVKKIFGESAAPSRSGIGPTGKDSMSSHFLYGKYDLGKVGKLSAYVYSLDYDHKDALDTNTFGAQFTGSYALNDEWSIVYLAGLAAQSDAYDSTLDHSESYYHIEVGAKWTSLAFKIGYEVLTGDGTSNFATPLATVHKFNGWADVLLPLSTVSLRNGLEDLYFTVGGAIPEVDGLKAAVFFHQFSQNNGSDDYGTEIDAVATYKLKQVDPGLTVGAKLALYSADDDSTTSDVNKYWLWTEYSF